MVTMPTRADLYPLFSDVVMSSDDANAIAAALKDIAECDGMHEEELLMIEDFVGAVDGDLGALEPTRLGEMTPQKLAQTLVDPTLRQIAIRSSVLLAMADGVISSIERQRLLAYATALGMTTQEYEAVESLIVDWVKSGDLGSALS